MALNIRRKGNIHLVHDSHLQSPRSFKGVTDIETNVQAKTVVVTHADSVSKQDMLQKLEKVGSFN